jgi:hypothetical protein
VPESEQKRFNNDRRLEKFIIKKSFKFTSVFILLADQRIMASIRTPPMNQYG